MYIVPDIVQRHIEEVQQRFTHYTQNDFLDQYIDTRQNDSSEKQMLPVLHMMLQAGGLPMATINLLCTAGALIQDGLSTHGKIESYAEESDTARQLSVLAGDYYSGRYYQVLANADLVYPIKIFAAAIQQINEAKMSRHFAPYETIDVNLYITWLEKIHASLLTNLVAEYAFDKGVWHDICLNLSLANALIHEADWIPSHRSGISFKLVLLYEAVQPMTSEAYAECVKDRASIDALFAKYNIDRSLAMYIDKFLSQATTSITKLPDGIFKEELGRYIHHLRDTTPCC